MTILILLILLIPSLASAQSALQSAAQALNPGQWVAFSTNGFNNGLIMQPSGGSIAEYVDKGRWDPIHRQAMVNGGEHGASAIYRSRVVIYDDATNTWSAPGWAGNNTGLPVPSGAQVYPLFDDAFPEPPNFTCGGFTCSCYGFAPISPAPLGPDGVTPLPLCVGGGMSHGFHETTVNTVTGDFYHRQSGSGKTMRYTASSGTWSQCSNQNSNHQVAGAIEYFPDRNSLVYLDGDWGVWELDLSSGNCTSSSWVQRASGLGGGFSPQLAGISGYSNQSSYSPYCHCIVLGGGGLDNRTLWRYMANGTFQPVSTNNGPSFIRVPGDGVGSVFTYDPAGGKILVWTNANAQNGVYEYDGLADSWTFVSTSGPAFPTIQGTTQNVYAIPISKCGNNVDCNVIMFVDARSGGGGRITLYKHGTAVVDTTPPSVPGIATGTPVGSSQINLSWAASIDNESGVSSYQVDRCQGATCTTGFVQVATPTTNAYNDTKLTSQTAYRYRVRAVNGQGGISGNSTLSAAITTGTADTTAPVVAVTDPPNTTPVSAGTAGSYNLIGTATDAVGVTTITLVNDRGGSYTVNVSGTSVSWARSVNLFNGTNVISVTAQDADGNSTFPAVVRTITTTIVGASATASPTNTTPGGTINVAFTGVASPTTRDWMGIYPIGAPDTFNPAYLWLYVYGTPNCTSATIAYAPNSVFSGSCNFTMPATPGSYNFRLFSNDAETNPLAVSNTVTVTAVVDTQAPTTPTGLGAIAINTDVNLSWIASSDNIGVTGYRVERSPAGCASFAQVYTPSVNTQIDSGLAATTTYCYRVRATDAAGNLSGYSAIAQATTGTPAPSGGNFATRCGTPGVLRCFNFDTTDQFTNGAGGGNGAWGWDFGIWPPNGTSDYTKSARDTSVFAEGASSLRFDITGNTGSDGAGAWTTNFSTNRSVLIGEGETVYIGWQQRFDNNFTDIELNGGGTMAHKFAIVSAGDLPTCNQNNPGTPTCPGSCTDIEVVPSGQNPSTNNVIRLYNSCVSFAGFEYFDSALGNVNVQNGVGCLYPAYLSPPCAKMVPNEWMYFKMRLTVGTWNQPNSTMQFWVARQGQTPQMILNFSPGSGHPWTAFRNDNTHEYGKVWLLPYVSGKDSSQAHATQHTWYDNLIISTADFPDPGAGTGPPPSGITITQPPNNGSIQVNTATINLGGTVQ